MHLAAFVKMICVVQIDTLDSSSIQTHNKKEIMITWSWTNGSASSGCQTSTTLVDIWLRALWEQEIQLSARCWVGNWATLKKTTDCECALFKELTCKLTVSVTITGYNKWIHWMIITQTSEEMTLPRQADKGCLLAASLAGRLAWWLTNLENISPATSVHTAV